MTYNDKIDADTQISMEENIATLLPHFGVEEEDAAELGKIILKKVLARFRPDLFEDNHESFTTNGEYNK